MGPRECIAWLGYGNKALFYQQAEYVNRQPKASHALLFSETNILLLNNSFCYKHNTSPATLLTLLCSKWPVLTRSNGVWNPSFKTLRTEILTMSTGLK
jgi:hypothetical protein